MTYIDEKTFLQKVQKQRSMPHTLILEHVSPATRLLEKRRQMFEVQEALEQQKLEFDKKEEMFKRQEEVLKKKDLDLQESLIRFSKFLQENDSKKARAIKKAADETKIGAEKRKEIEALSKQYENLKFEKDSINETLEKNLRYYRYLESVLEVADEFQEIGDILARHATMKATNQDLKEQQVSCEQETEQVRTDYIQYRKNKMDEILNLNNEIARLKKEVEQYEGAAMSQESKKDYSLQIASQKTLEYGVAIMSTDNLFNRCRSKSSIFYSQQSNPLNQLDVVGNFVSDLGYIVKQHKEMIRNKSRNEEVVAV
eukprot:TRINITY_DN7828_c0_g1_i1.p1 TRINITY_DN7828_c0_g1~~TRINITY_DN7828_c0_g1_i1.p1  ORF type:complete len:313 (-),score=45.32 TRINITY_DN7828_c0_g1_i1:322-1260(-)